MDVVCGQMAMQESIPKFALIAVYLAECALRGVSLQDRNRIRLQDMIFTTAAVVHAC